MGGAGRGDREVLHRERLTPPWWLWLLLAGAAASVGLAAVVVVPPLAAAAATLVAFALGAAGLVLSTPLVEVASGHLRAGQARAPVGVLGRAVALDAETARRLRGPDSDARAYHLVRGWVPRAVLVEVTDPDDPTPYWYVASRRPEQLAAAVEAARAEAR